MQLSIIIVNYNVRHFLEQCLCSVNKATNNITSEVFVVDNNSTDDSLDMVRKNFPNVHLIHNKENVGFSKANNQAIEISKGKYVLYINILLTSFFALYPRNSISMSLLIIIFINIIILMMFDQVQNHIYRLSLMQ